MTKARDLASNSSGSKPTLIDAKADLIVGTGADAASRLAVGSNGDTIVADSAASTGLRWQSANTGNLIINGGQDIWQRGTSFASAASAVYTADRWQFLRASGVSGGTLSRQTGATGFEYCARAQRDSGNTGTQVVYYGTSLESSQSIPFADKTVVISFYARKGANYSSASDALSVSVATGTGTNQNIFSGLTGQVTVGTSVTLTTSWQRFSYSTTLASNITQIAAYFSYTPVGTAGAADYFEVTGVQLELGTTPTAFRKAGGTLQGELAACQRYFQKSFGIATTPGDNVASLGMVYYTRQASSGNTEPSAFVRLAPNMRTAPSVTLYNPYTATAGQWSDGSTNSANARAFNAVESSFIIDNTDVAINVQAAGIQYAASAEL